jgi:hypothetical protein
MRKSYLDIINLFSPPRITQPPFAGAGNIRWLLSYVSKKEELRIHLHYIVTAPPPRGNHG